MGHYKGVGFVVDPWDPSITNPTDYNSGDDYDGWIHEGYDYASGLPSSLGRPYGSSVLDYPRSWPTALKTPANLKLYNQVKQSSTLLWLLLGGGLLLVLAIKRR